MKGIGAFFIVLFIIPLGHICTILALKQGPAGQLIVTAACVILAIAIIYATRFFASAAWQTFWGLIAGTLLWAGLVEIGVRLGSKTIGVEDEKVLQLTLSIIIPLVLYLLFNEHIRCSFFVGLRSILRIARQNLTDIPVNNWGPRMAFKMFAIVWIGHVVLFYMYDDAFFGITSLTCKAFFIFCLLAGAYLLYRLTKIREMDFALRYAIPTVIIVWSCIETIQKWRALP